ncbi:MAG: hypothetical protein V1672_00815 [Candidatus Diapherotrites archaeon]
MLLNYGLPVIFSLSEFFADMNLVIKIFALLTMVSFVKNRLGTSPLAIILMTGLFFFIFFDFWRLFGTIYVLYMLLMFGVSGILIDFFFVSQMGGGGMQGTPSSSALSTGADLAMRSKMLRRMRRG